MGRIVKLINVSEANNNKFYSMTENDDGTTFDAHYGRVGATGVHETYPMAMWDKKYREKIGKKGYTDITHLVATAVSGDADDVIKLSGPSASKYVSELVNFLQSAAKGTIKQNYTVAVANVTEKQVDFAQNILDTLTNLVRQNASDRESINKMLLELYRTIPRKMSHTKNFLLQDTGKTGDNRPIEILLGNEQDLLDVMRGQVATQSSTPSAANDNTMDLSKLGLTIVDATPEELDEIRKGTDLDFTKIGRIFRVTHTGHQARYDKVPVKKNEKLFYHGSRNENWWSILNTGLKIRPAGAVYSGSMFGDGIYFADKAQKSIGYTSLRGSYWASGSSSKAFLALYSVNLGNYWDLFAGGQRHSTWMTRLDLATCRSKGYDSAFAKGGADLRNNEYIVYEEARATVKYLIELKG